MHDYSALPPFEGVVAMLAAAEGGSFTAAADALGLTHGSVSRRIGHLEHWLGTSLFERQARGVRLTPAGQRFAATAGRALGLLAESADQWRPRIGRSLVRLSIVPSFARLWLIPRLAILQGDDLAIELTIEHRTSDLDAREADIAIRYGAGPYTDVESRLLFAERFVPCASPALAASLGTAATANALIAHPLLHDSNIAPWQSWLAG